jgi:hypothetical protein
VSRVIGRGFTGVLTSANIATAVKETEAPGPPIGTKRHVVHIFVPTAGIHPPVGLGLLVYRAFFLGERRLSLRRVPL